MPRLSQAEIRNNAIAFVHEWKDETSERAESQTFWNEFFQVFGLRRRDVAVYEKAVQRADNKFGKIDVFWKGVVLAEHKSAGQDLDKATSQAFEYVQGLIESERPQFVLISDFKRFRLYDLESGADYSFGLDGLPDRIQLFGFISGYQKREFREQDPVNIDAAMKLGALHDALDAAGYHGHKLEAFLVRLVYCLFADDTGIFTPRESLLRFLQKSTASNCGAMLGQLFEVLDTPDRERMSTLDEDLLGFQYVNGALFRERFPMPSFDEAMRKLLIDACSTDWSKVSPAIFGSLFQSVMDKEKRRNLGAHYTSEKNILKVVHGLFLDELLAEFDAIKTNLGKLRSFHDKLAGLRFFDPACGCGNFLVITYREMRRLELAVLKQIRFLTGNVQQELAATKLSKLSVDQYYGIEIEEFPAEIARVALWVTDHLANIELSSEFGVAQFELPLEHTPNIVHGNALRLDWNDDVLQKPAREQGRNTNVASTALVNSPAPAPIPSLNATNEIVSGATRRADIQLNAVPEGDEHAATGSTHSGSVDVSQPNVGFDPTLLHSSPSATESQEGLYILGNPPFVGAKMMNDAQRADMAYACGDVPNFGLLDFVCGWYVKAAKFLHPTTFSANSLTEYPIPKRARVAFVSTNSITQGEQVGVLWNYLLQSGISIRFAHRTFKWTNEAPGKAAVFCVIIGFGKLDIWPKKLFDYEFPTSEPQQLDVDKINPYLIAAENVLITRRQDPVCDVPGMHFGNMPLDGGHLIIQDREALCELIDSDPNVKHFIKGFSGADEFIKGNERWCLWLNNVSPSDIRSFSRAVLSRIEAVRKFRLASRAPSTQRFAETPYLFRDRNLPASYLLVPSVSSERRRYVPIGFMTSDVVPSNLTLIVPNASTYHFGVMTSTMHNAWMRQVCGRLKSDYRYSKDIVYNNFPWPDLTDKGERIKDKVEAAAQGILDARAKFPGSTMAALYDPLTMPKELVDAHRANDEAVDAAYGKRGFKNELERLEFLFDLYRKYTEPLGLIESSMGKKRRGLK
jgi:hypothetical protein